MLLPPSADSLILTRTLRYCVPSFNILALPISSRLSTPSMAEGEKTKAWPASSSTICSKMSCTPRLDASPSLDTPARWDLSAASHAGDVKRCTIVIELRSRRLGDIVGSCVAMMTRVAKCRCWRITDRRLLRRFWSQCRSFWAKKQGKRQVSRAGRSFRTTKHNVSPK